MKPATIRNVSDQSRARVREACARVVMERGFCTKEIVREIVYTCIPFEELARAGACEIYRQMERRYRLLQPSDHTSWFRTVEQFLDGNGADEQAVNKLANRGLMAISHHCTRRPEAWLGLSLCKERGVFIAADNGRHAEASKHHVPLNSITTRDRVMEFLLSVESATCSEIQEAVGKQVSWVLKEFLQSGKIVMTQRSADATYAVADGANTSGKRNTRVLELMRRFGGPITEKQLKSMYENGEARGNINNLKKQGLVITVTPTVIARYSAVRGESK